MSETVAENRSDALEAVAILRPTLERLKGWRLMAGGSLRLPGKPPYRDGPTPYFCPLEAAAKALGGERILGGYEAHRFLSIPSKIAGRIMRAADDTEGIPNDPVRRALLEACSVPTS